MRKTRNTSYPITTRTKRKDSLLGECACALNSKARRSNWVFWLRLHLTFLITRTFPDVFHSFAFLFFVFYRCLIIQILIIRLKETWNAFSSKIEVILWPNSQRLNTFIQTTNFSLRSIVLSNLTNLITTWRYKLSSKAIYT